MGSVVITENQLFYKVSGGLGKNTPIDELMELAKDERFFCFNIILKDGEENEAAEIASKILKLNKKPIKVILSAEEGID